MKPLREIACVAVLLGVSWLLAPSSAGAQETAGLPDLDQETPGQLTVAPTGTGAQQRWWLGFSSAVSNIGEGPFVVHGHRPNTATDTMTADQLIGGDTSNVVPGIGRLRYVTSPTHEHWHLLRFERYELRRAGSGRVVVRDRKSGFCLGDRYGVDGPVPPAAPADPVYTTNCGLRRTSVLEITEGISVGYGDVYGAYLEYQDLPLDGLRPGRYVLVHSVNVKGAIQETSLANDSASVLLDLRWPDGRPRLRILRDCPDSAACDTPAVADPTTVKTGLRRRWICHLRSARP